MKQRGFTMVELLGVLSLLAILSLLIIPIVSNSVHDSNQDLYNVQIENIKEAARLWSADHVGELPDEGDTKEICRGFRHWRKDRAKQADWKNRLYISGV